MNKNKGNVSPEGVDISGHLESEGVDFSRHCEPEGINLSRHCERPAGARQSTQSLGLAVPGKHLPQGHGASVAPWYKSIVYFAWDSLTVSLGKCFPSLSLNLDAADKKSPAAFSLVEMLMALLVASLLMAALAPVITKRFGDNINVAGATGGGRAPAMFKCWDYDSPELQYADDGSGYKVLPEDYPVEEAWIVNFILASGGGGGAGATTSETVPDSYKEPTDGKDGIKIEFNMDDFEIESMIGGGGGGGGGAAQYSGAICTGGPSESKCECMGATFDSKNNLCVSPNQGSKNLTDATSTCSNLAPAGKYSLPTMGQLANWSTDTFYSTLGITSGQTVWSSTTAQGKCSDNNNGAYCVYWSGGGNSMWCGYTMEDCNKVQAACKAQVGGTWYGCAFYTSTTKPNRSCASTNGWACNGVSNIVHNCGFASCSSWYTNHYFYQLSGTTWSQSFDTVTTNSRNTYCVYSDSADVNGEKFFSLSGGGGGGAPAISNNEFDTGAKNKLRQKIRENIGGYIVLSPGEGGSGGAGASNKGAKATNGTNGGDSCIIIQNSFRQNKFKLCVKGGKGGGGADASISNAATEGFGAAGEKTEVENSCYTVDYTEAGEVTNEFACTLEGKAGGLGGASTNNPTTGGKGGASVLNSNQVTNSGADGVTPNSSTNPGAGGGGGTTTKSGTGSSASFNFGAGGDGAKGYIKLNFNRKYEAAGGGGGGAGYVAHIKNVSVGKSATCKIRVGYGGVGGGSGIKGTDGGESSITCSNAANITYRITGGKGGQIGTSASATAGSKSTGGLGGEAGTYDDAGNIFTRLFSQGNFTGYKGLDGKQGGAGDDANYKEGVRSAGGRGGTSGTGEKGKCGGLYNESGVCMGVSTDENNDIVEPIQDALNGGGYGSGEISIPTKDSIVEATPKFGKAGAGGGGGAWYMGKTPGKGGDGLGGYVCIYWDTIE